MNPGIIPHQFALPFILGGRSYVTFHNPKSGNHFTFNVQKHKVNDIYFVKVLTGPDQYTFIGTVQDGVYKHSRKSSFSDDCNSVKTFSFVLNRLSQNNLPEFIEILHDGRCARCARQLTHPESIEIGFGPECVKHIFDKTILRDLKISKLLK